MFKEVDLKEAVNSVIEGKSAYLINLEERTPIFDEVEFLTLNEILCDKDKARFIVDEPEVEE